MHIVDTLASLTLLIQIVEASSEQHRVNLIVSPPFQGAALVEDKGHVLSSTPLEVSFESGLVEVGCSLKCVQTKGCVSFNVAVKPNSQGLYRCELLDKEKYNASTEYKTSQDFNHYNFKNLISFQSCSRRTTRDGQSGKGIRHGWTGGKPGWRNNGNYGGPPPGAAGGFGGGGGGAENPGASGNGGGYSGGGVGVGPYCAGGGGGSFCSGNSCKGVTGGNDNLDGFVTITRIE